MQGKDIKNQNKIGHITAFVTIFIWGTTFISTKVLLVDFHPIEILLLRFVIGFLALLVVFPHPLKIKSWKQEGMFMLAGICGVCMYYLLENIALTYTMASNVGVITSSAPFFTAILIHLFVKEEEKLHANFFVGFIVAMAGIFLISFNGSTLKLNPVGDLLSIAAAFFWGCYSILGRKISKYGYNTIQTTRRTFFYGLLFMIPTLFFMDFSTDLKRFANPVNLGNLIFLGLGASALCFVTWNYAVKILGAIRTSVYIYIVPVITVVTSMIVLKEKITLIAAIGTLLTLCGLVLSEKNWKKIGS